MKSNLWRTIRRDYGPYLPLSPYLFIVLFPFYWMIITTFKRDNDLYSLTGIPFWFKEPPTLAHVQLLLRDTLFLVWLKNSLLIGVCVVIVTLALGLPAAYALARMRFPGNRAMSTGMFLSYLIPPALLFLPLSQLVRGMGFGDSIWSLVIVYPSFTVPFCTWLLMGYFRTVPKEVEECAMVDGATRLQALWRIVLPIAVPGLVCAALFAFTLSWNEFIYALTFTSSSEQITASVGVTTELIRGDIYYWGSLMAGAVLASVPIVILYVFFLDYYVSGLTAGAIK